MISAYSSLITYSEGEWENYLHRIALYDIFKDLLKEFPDKNDFTCVARYILYSYSKESDMVVLGTDWLTNKQRIFEKVSNNPEKRLYDALVHLKNKTVLNTVENWLDHQNLPVHKQLCLLKDLLVQMQIASISDIKKSTGEIDYEAKMNCAKYSIELKSMVKDMESELIQNDVRLKEAMKDLRSAKKNATTMGLETTLKED